MPVKSQCEQEGSRRPSVSILRPNSMKLGAWTTRPRAFEARLTRREDQRLELDSPMNRKIEEANHE